MIATSRLALAFVALAAAACASSESVELPPLDSPIRASIPSGSDPAIEAAIAASLSAVELPEADGGGTDASSVLFPAGHLDPDAIRGLIRQLESLDGESRVVCLPTSGYVFGECAFPPSRGDATPP